MVGWRKKVGGVGGRAKRRSGPGNEEGRDFAFKDGESKMRSEKGKKGGRGGGNIIAAQRGWQLQEVISFKRKKGLSSFSAQRRGGFRK